MSKALKSVDVVIVGAGLSGLAAALELRRAAPASTFAILEARNRVGGRVHTTTAPGFPDLRVDCGASWLHNYWDNPLTPLAAEAGIDVVYTDYKKLFLYQQGSHGKHIDDTLVKKAYAEFQRGFHILLEEPHKCLDENGQDVPMLKAIERARKLARGGRPDDPLRERILDFWYFQAIIDNMALQYDEFSYGGWNADMSEDVIDFDSDGGDYIPVGGVFPIVAKLYKDVEAETYLETPVTKIEIQSDSLVRVSTCKGDFIAKHVIVTIPVAVLASNMVQFEPPLPQKKQDVISSLSKGFATLDKITVKFPERFWPSYCDFVVNIPEDPCDFEKEFIIFMSLEDFGTHGLTTYSYGRTAKEMEKLSDEEIIAKIMTTLKGMFGESIPQPIAYNITRWASDPYARGTYQVPHTPDWPKWKEVLTEPIDSRIFFAGEATAAFAGTMHGAWESGEREGRRVAQLLSQM